MQGKAINLQKRIFTLVRCESFTSSTSTSFIFCIRHEYILPLIKSTPWSCLPLAHNSSSPKAKSIKLFVNFSTSKHRRHPLRFSTLKQNLNCRLLLIIVMPSAAQFLLSGRDLANRTIREQRDTIRDQGSQLAKMQYLMDLMVEDIEELLVEQQMRPPCDSFDIKVYTSKDYLWECPDYEDDPRSWQRWKDLHPWLDDLDMDERAWRCAEGTIKALHGKLTRAAKEVLNCKIDAVKEAFRRIDAEGEVAVLKKKLERLHRRAEQQHGDEHANGLIGLAAFENWQFCEL